MNYLKIYNDIIANAKNRTLSDNTYTEIHHIKPKCLDGTNDADNLVTLTLREHFICHKLLVHIYPNEVSLKYALWMICVTTLDAKKSVISGNITYKQTNVPKNMRIKHFLNEFEKHINITSKDYEYCKMLYYNSATGKTRTVEQRKRISAATKKAMQNADIVKLRRKGVLGTKYYYDLVTYKSYKWFPGDPDIDLTKYAWGRGKKVSEQAKQKIKQNSTLYKKEFYYNENLKCSTCFCISQIRQLPNTWKKGRKYGGYNKMKTVIQPLLMNVHFKLACNNIFIDDIFFHINLLQKKEISLGLLTVNEDYLKTIIDNNSDLNDGKIITLIYENIIRNIDNIKDLNNTIYST